MDDGYRRRLKRTAATATAAITGSTSNPGVFVPVLFPPVLLPLPFVENGIFESGAQSPHHSLVVWFVKLVYSAAKAHRSVADALLNTLKTALSVLPEIVRFCTTSFTVPFFEEIPDPLPLDQYI